MYAPELKQPIDKTPSTGAGFSPPVRATDLHAPAVDSAAYASTLTVFPSRVFLCVENGEVSLIEGKNHQAISAHIHENLREIAPLRDWKTLAPKEDSPVERNRPVLAACCHTARMAPVNPIYVAQSNAPVDPVISRLALLSKQQQFEQFTDPGQSNLLVNAPLDIETPGNLRPHNYKKWKQTNESRFGQAISTLEFRAPAEIELDPGNHKLEVRLHTKTAEHLPCGPTYVIRAIFGNSEAGSHILIAVDGIQRIDDSLNRPEWTDAQGRKSPAISHIEANQMLKEIGLQELSAAQLGDRPLIALIRALGIPCRIELNRTLGSDTPEKSYWVPYRIKHFLQTFSEGLDDVSDDKEFLVIKEFELVKPLNLKAAHIRLLMRWLLAPMHWPYLRSQEIHETVNPPLEESLS